MPSWDFGDALEEVTNDAWTKAMPLGPKKKLQTYAHALNNNSQFALGFSLGAGSGLAVFTVCLSLAYALDILGVRPMMNGLFWWI
jgi:hypothetical protein